MTRAVNEYPVINAVIDKSMKNVIYRDYVDMIIPLNNGSQNVNVVIRDCQNKSFTDILKEINLLQERVNKNQLSIEDLQLGTIALSYNQESLCSINAIEENTTVKLGINNIEVKPHCVDNNPKRIEPRKMMWISLTYDHRLIDGREGVLFLRKCKEIIENPIRLIFDI